MYLLPSRSSTFWKCDSMDDWSKLKINSKNILFGKYHGWSYIFLEKSFIHERYCRTEPSLKAILLAMFISEKTFKLISAWDLDPGYFIIIIILNNNLGHNVESTTPGGA